MKSLKKWFADFLDKDTCPTCGEPEKSLNHRQKCLKKSEKRIYSQLKKNRKSYCKKHEPDFSLPTVSKGWTKCKNCGSIIELKEEDWEPGAMFAIRNHKK